MGLSFRPYYFPCGTFRRFFPLPYQEGGTEKKRSKRDCECRRRGKVSAATFSLVCRLMSETERRKRKYKNQTERETLTFWHFQVWWDFPLPFRSWSFSSTFSFLRCLSPGAILAQSRSSRGLSQFRAAEKSGKVDCPIYRISIIG